MKTETIIHDEASWLKWVDKVNAEMKKYGIDCDKAKEQIRKREGCYKNE